MFDDHQKEKGGIENQGGISNSSQTENSGEIKKVDNKTERDFKTISKISASSPLSKSKVPQNKIEDIFAGSETTGDVNPPNVPKPNIFKPINQEAKRLKTGGINMHAEQASKNKKLFFLLVIIVVSLLLILSGVWVFRYFVTKPTNLEQEKAIQDNLSPKEANIFKEDSLEENNKKPSLPNNQENFQEKEIEKTNSAVENNNTKDSDNDGLSDAEEINLGTDIHKTDTDNDKLFDREEVYVYKTDPLDPDTDKDGFMDGEEVLKGYNPLGPGKLHNIK